jgi:hypothetical protein
MYVVVCLLSERAVAADLPVFSQLSEADTRGTPLAPLHLPAAECVGAKESKRRKLVDVSRARARTDDCFSESHTSRRH